MDERASNQRQIQSLFSEAQREIYAIFDSEAYKAYLRTMAKFHSYSPNNLALINRQAPEATHVAGFNTWKQMGRQVRKGEKGIAVLAPVTYREPNKPLEKGNTAQEDLQNRKVIRGFRRVHVFDISQTEGRPLPELTQDLQNGVENYDQMMVALQGVSPYPIQLEQINGATRGYCNFTDGRIAIKEGMSESQTVKTAVHEIAHALFHGPETDQSRRTEEVEAESCAFVVCARYGINTSDYSFPYIALWSSDRELGELQESLTRIQRQADQLITAIDGRLESLRQQQTVRAEQVPAPELERQTKRPDPVPKPREPERQPEQRTANRVRRPSFTDEEYRVASKTNMLDYLQRNGYELQKAGRDYQLKQHNSLKISADGTKWYWYSRDMGGQSPIGLVKALEGVGDVEAVKRLCGGQYVREPLPVAPTQEIRELQLPEASREARRVVAYLCKTRGIATSVVVDQLNRGNIFESAKYHNAVFVGRDGEGRPRYAAQRGTLTQGKPFRMDAPGSDKRYPFHMAGTSDTVYVFEAPIDALSHATMEVYKGQDWRQDHRISLGGLSEKALDWFLSQRAEIKRIGICLDNDDPGQRKAQELLARYTQQGYTCQIIRPQGKDFNDMLMAHVNSQREPEQRTQGDMASRVSSAKSQATKRQADQPPPPQRQQVVKR